MDRALKLCRELSFASADWVSSGHAASQWISALVGLVRMERSASRWLEGSSASVQLVSQVLLVRPDW